MSQSIYLTIYFRHSFDERQFSEDMQKARSIFRVLWELEGTGFDKKGNIKGLKELYYSMEYDDDAEDLENENGELSILKMEKPDIAPNISFNFHNYGGELDLGDGIDLRDIYKLFAEILSSCFGYVVKLSDSYDELKYSIFYDEDGKQYHLNKDRSEVLNEIKNIHDAKEDIKVAKDIIKKSKELLKNKNIK